MHWIFRQKDAWLDKPFFRLEEIKVDPYTFGSDVPYALPLYVGYVIDTALDEKWYVGAELPEDAEAFRNLWRYRGEIESNGHYGFAGNTGGDVAAWRRASILCDKLGLIGYRDILDDFVAFDPEYSEYMQDILADEPDREMELMEPYWEFGDRFSALERSGIDLTAYLREWLKDRPWIIVEANAPDLFRDPDIVVPPHPLAERRKEAHRKLHAAELEASRRLLGEHLKRNRD